MLRARATKSLASHPVLAPKLTPAIVATDFFVVPCADEHHIKSTADTDNGENTAILVDNTACCTLFIML